MGIWDNLTKWQNYVHYVILAILLTGAFHFMGIHAFHTENFLPNLNFLLMIVALFVADTIVHILFAVLPEPLKWED